MSEGNFVRLVHSEESDVDETPRNSNIIKEIIPGDPALGLDPYSRYIKDSNNQMYRLVASTSCSDIIDFGGMNFLIMDEPIRTNLSSFFYELKRYDIKHLFCVCDSRYDVEDFKKQGVTVYNVQFADGGSPDLETIDKWLRSIQEIFSDSPKTIVGVHCVAGLGRYCRIMILRAPLLVAIALMERGLCYEDAVLLIRLRRKGAINNRQIEFLSTYIPTGTLKFKKPKRLCAIFYHLDYLKIVEENKDEAFEMLKEDDRIRALLKNEDIFNMLKKPVNLLQLKDDIEKKEVDNDQPIENENVPNEEIQVTESDL